MLSVNAKSRFSKKCIVKLKKNITAQEFSTRTIDLLLSILLCVLYE